MNEKLASLFDETIKSYNENCHTPGDVSELKDAFVSDCEMLFDKATRDDEGVKMRSFLKMRGIETRDELSRFYYGSVTYPRDKNGDEIEPGAHVDCIPYGSTQVTQRNCEVAAITSSSFVYYDECGVLKEAVRPDMFWRLHVTERFDDLVDELFDRARECNDLNDNDRRLKAEFVRRFEIAAADGGWEG